MQVALCFKSIDWSHGFTGCSSTHCDLSVKDGHQVLKGTIDLECSWWMKTWRSTNFLSGIPTDFFFSSLDWDERWFISNCFNLSTLTPAPIGNMYDVLYLYLYIVYIQDYAIKIMISNHYHITDKDTIHIYVLSAFKGLIDLLIL